MAKQDLMDTIRKLLKERKLEPYLKHIRFPCFRNLEQGLRIDFNFPLTAIVGQNGGNKSSVLRAVYGCPGNNSIGKFWFSTHVDPIDEHGGRSRFIYGYYQPEAKKDVEVIKTRIRKTFERKVNGRDVKRKDPDYWETARPSIRDGMERMPKEGSKTRWKTIKKNVLFMDFRSEISAFDKYFYHGELKRTLSDGTKQDFIRRSYKNFRETIDKNLKTPTRVNRNQNDFKVIHLTI